MSACSPFAEMHAEQDINLSDVFGVVAVVQFSSTGTKNISASRK